MSRVLQLYPCTEKILVLRLLTTRVSLQRAKVFFVSEKEEKVESDQPLSFISNFGIRCI